MVQFWFKLQWTWYKSYNNRLIQDKFMTENAIPKSFLFSPNYFPFKGVNFLLMKSDYEENYQKLKFLVSATS